MSSRKRHCRTCNNQHTPPTGQRCSRSDAQNTSSVSESAVRPDVLTMLVELKNSMRTMTNRLDALETRAAADNVGTHRLDGRIRQRPAVVQIPRIDATRSQSSCSVRGKTSGSNRTADDLYVKKDLPWPHFHVRRGPAQRPVHYDDLTSTEFTYGFLTMVEECTEPQQIKDTMLRRLKELIRDTIDFAWPTMRNLFGLIMQDLEKGKLSWGDDAKFQEMRVLFMHKLTHEFQPEAAQLSSLDYQDNPYTLSSDSFTDNSA